MPVGWALDAQGHPTTDPAAGLGGFIQFVGGHKGYGLSLMVDMLAGLMSDGSFLDQVEDMWLDTAPQKVSHFFIVIDPIRMLGAGNYYDKVDSFIATIKSSAPFQKGNEVLIPGEPEYFSINDRRKNGIPLAQDLLDTVKRLAQA